jgi:signal transduction histidine kinase
MIVDAASNQVARRPEDARLQLQSARVELGTAVDDIRRLINQLGDPALESLGLVAALRDQAARFGQDRLCVTVEAGPIPLLPAAVEVAAYRIASEALANVARHADASTCTIRIDAESSLHMTISDDGRGFGPERSPGVGLASMQQRAGDLGGECRIVPRPGAGTEVVVELPLSAASGRREAPTMIGPA